ncbi:Glycosyltransferase, catalytic subunit of cellulose synthase and poly-beta-1,6-N-acetylglucosamine synthase [Belliella buryatensis]|uniref:Glycosyltransferase, catalytic subunit of cellulose synthase and poly-beta-1,6-N-acetylglucosamine synthase n=1 Tax=Belliella buryatensis TaxID=1500549 RepID=A0A239FBA7_9BACT|nr:glycosyltransferase [Belliella buryatensis]SNS54097.1 Glycosyltransferase, catalytic subunit of cellulose synthase and poly-beta-1,6-N-acetylglucosamine synthase [Belliella buryatensis]
MITLALFVGIVYAVSLLLLATEWKSELVNPSTNSSHQSLSLLIPFRNEADNLLRIFTSIEQLDVEHLQVVWINDHSEDYSVERLSALVEKSTSRFDHLIIESKGKGKKAALESGIQIALGEIILTTDSDCVLPRFWLQEMLHDFQNSEIQLISGPVMTKGGDSFFYKFQQIDWASILLVSNFSIRRGQPLMCSGANLAYRKNAFIAVNGYAGNREVASGDDEFLLKKITAKYGSSAVSYRNGLDCLVLTKPQTDWKSLFEQRVRWASKWKYHDTNHAFSSFIPAIFQLFWLSSFFLTFIDFTNGLIALGILWSLKIFSEWIALGKVLKSFKYELPIQIYLKTSLIHPFYVIYTVVKALKGKYKWKGR